MRKVIAATLIMCFLCLFEVFSQNCIGDKIVNGFCSEWQSLEEDDLVGVEAVLKYQPPSWDCPDTAKSQNKCEDSLQKARAQFYEVWSDSMLPEIQRWYNEYELFDPFFPSIRLREEDAIANNTIRFVATKAETKKVAKEEEVVAITEFNGAILETGQPRRKQTGIFRDSFTATHQELHRRDLRGRVVSSAQRPTSAGVIIVENPEGEGLTRLLLGF